MSYGYEYTKSVERLAPSFLLRYHRSHSGIHTLSLAIIYISADIEDVHPSLVSESGGWAHCCADENGMSIQG